MNVVSSVEQNIPLLTVENLEISFVSTSKKIKAIDGISFQVSLGKTVGIVGESGCGKSITSLSLMRLLPQSGQITGGKIFFDNEDILIKSEKEMRKIRGNKMSMIFQEPMTSLNPVLTIGNQISEVFQVHQAMSQKDARENALEMLNKVRIPSPEKRMNSYPHELSGGMRQRVMIAMALSCQPKLLIADEPTTALDVTIQAQILALINHLQKQFSMSVILITHDLGVVAETCDDVVVMYAGQVVEKAPVSEFFQNTMHPYALGLLKSSPKLGERKNRLYAIPGLVPSLSHLPQGCRFQDRCPLAGAECKGLEEPPLREVKKGHFVACFKV